MVASSLKQPLLNADFNYLKANVVAENFEAGSHTGDCPQFIHVMFGGRKGKNPEYIVYKAYWEFCFLPNLF